MSALYHVISRNLCVNNQDLHFEKTGNVFVSEVLYPELFFFYNRICKSSVNVNTASKIIAVPDFLEPPYHNISKEENLEWNNIPADKRETVPNNVKWNIRKECNQIKKRSMWMAHILRIAQNANKEVVVILRYYHDHCQLLNHPLISYVHFEVDGLGERNIPYVGNVLWKKSFGIPPWYEDYYKWYLYSFTGSLRGTHRSRHLRRKLSQMCTRDFLFNGVSFNSHLFKCRQSKNLNFFNPSHMNKVLEIKRMSTFCVEPPGFSDVRKSTIDSMVSGCIPVLFMNREQFDNYMPIHFKWKRDLCVLLNDSQVENVTNILSAIPQSQVVMKQNLLKLYTQKLVYYLDDDADDAVRPMIQYVLSL